MPLSRIQVSLLGLFVITGIAGCVVMAARILLAMPRDDALWMLLAFVSGAALSGMAILASQWQAGSKMIAVAIIALVGIVLGNYFGSYAIGLVVGLICCWFGTTLLNYLFALCGIEVRGRKKD